MSAAAGALAVALAAGATAAPHPPSVAEVFARPLIEGDRPGPWQASPDGRWLAFAWNEHGQRSPRDVWLGDLLHPELPPRRLGRFADPTPAEPGSARPYVVRQGDEPRLAQADELDWSPRSDFVVAAAGGDLWLLPLDGPARRLTDTEAVEGSPRVSPDGRRVLFESDGNLFTLALAPGEPASVVQLTRHDEGLPCAEPRWSPDGTRIAFVRRTEKDRFDLPLPDYLKEKVEAGKTRGGFYAALPVVLPAAGGLPRLLDLGAKAPAVIDVMRFSDDGTELLIDGLSRDGRTRTVHVADLATPATPARLLDEEDDPAWAWTTDDVFAKEPATAFSPDGRHVLIVSERDGWARPWILSLDGQAPLRVGDGRFETSWATWRDDRTLIVLDNREAAHERRLHLIDVASGAVRALCDLPGTAALPELSRDRSALVFAHSRFAEPTNLWVARPAGGTCARATRTVPAAFLARSWVVPKVVTFPAADGTLLHGLLYEPPPQAPRLAHRPAVVFVHGAGYLQNVLDGWTWYAPNFKFHTLLAERGWVVLEVDYRGSAGYGRAFRTAVWKHLGGPDLDDLVAGVRWLRARRDIGRVGVYGGSYGGFLALMAMFRAPDWFDAGAALRFVSDWENYERTNPWYCEPRLGTPQDDPEAYRRSSPIHFAAGLRGPLLLLHGMRDSNVQFQDCVQLTARLIELGKPFETMFYPREGHGFDHPESWIDEYDRILRFFERTLAAPAPAR